MSALNTSKKTWKNMLGKPGWLSFFIDSPRWYVKMMAVVPVVGMVVVPLPVLVLLAMAYRYIQEKQ